jgi:branched-chain amino acid transport system ATP-binding protein
VSKTPGTASQTPPAAPRGPAAGLLRLERLSVERGGRAVVSDVSVDVPAGEVTALLGPNGAGKSSLILAVGGVLRPRRRRYSGLASELREKPELLRSAYLLRGSGGVVSG